MNVGAVRIPTNEHQDKIADDKKDDKGTPEQRKWWDLCVFIVTMTGMVSCAGWSSCGLVIDGRGYDDS